MANIDTLCPHCDTRMRLEEGEPVPVCTACGKPFPGLEPAPFRGTVLTRCTVCGGPSFYLQKDFNQNLGCLVFILGAGFAPFTHYLSLLAGLVLDLVLYLVLPYVAICYTCRSIYRGYARNAAHAAYDPNVAWAHRPREGPWASRPAESVRSSAQRQDPRA